MNSIRGLRQAKREGYGRVDRDLSITADGVIVVNHWPRPMSHDGFRDPLRKIHRRTPIWDLTWNQVRRLVARPGLYRIHTLRRDLEECARLELQAVLEPKNDDRWLQPSTWSRVDVIRVETGADVQVRVLAENNPNGEVVRLASKYFEAWEI